MFKKIAAIGAVATLAALGGAAAANAAPTPLAPFYHVNSTVISHEGNYMTPVADISDMAVDSQSMSLGYLDGFVAYSVGQNLVHLADADNPELSLSDPGPGYGNVDSIILRPTNDLGWQTFRLISTNDPGYYALQDVRTNQYVTDNGSGTALTGVADNRPGVGVPNNTYDGSVDQMWKFSNSGFGHHHYYSGGNDHHPYPHPTATATVGGATLTATEGISSFVNGTGPLGDSAGNTVTVTNNGTSPASVTVSETAAISGTVTSTVPVNSINQSCTYNVTGTDPVVDFVAPNGHNSSETETVDNGTPETFNPDPVTVATWEALQYGTDINITSSGSGCPAFTSVQQAVNTLQPGLTNVDLTVTLTPTAVSGTTNIPVTPSSVSEVFTG